MKQIQIGYENRLAFEKSLEKVRLACEEMPHGTVTFYLTWTEQAASQIELATQSIERLFPEAVFYGNEASGNIAHGDLTYGINVTCSLFESETARAELVWVEVGTQYSSLEDLWAYCRTLDGLRAIELIPSLAYLDTLKMDRNVPGLPDDILIFGGSSVNYNAATFDADVIAKGHPKTHDGMAVVLYFGDQLNFAANYVLGWKGLGGLLEVTRSTGKRIDEIDGAPAFSVYEKYLNLSIEDTDSLVFPLIVEEDGVEFIRTPQIINEDKSMLMFATIPEGSLTRIAYGDKNTILNSIYEEAEAIADFGPEAIKVFSCEARQLFWGDEEIGRETRILERIAPVCGFFTGGEILQFGDKLRVLNQTLTVISLRESSESGSPNVHVRDNAEDKSLVSRLTYFTEKVVAEEKAQRVLAEGLEKALSSEFRVMYYINLAEGQTTLLHGDEDAKKFLPIFQARTAEGLFDNFHKFYVDAVVEEEDRDRVKSVMNAENMRKVLADSPGMSVNFRVRRNLVDPVYTEMRIFKAGEEGGKLNAFVLAFRLTDEELVNALELNKQLQSEIMDEMLGDDGLFLIDYAHNTRKAIHDRAHGAGHTEDEDRSSSFDTYVDQFVVEADRARLREAASPAYVKEHLKDQKEFKVLYRDTTTGTPHFYEMRMVRFSDTEVLQSFRDCDEEVSLRQVTEKLIGEYDAIYVVDLNENQIRPIRSSKVSSVGAIEQSTAYTPILLRFAETVAPEYRQDWINFSDVEYMKRYMSTQDRREYVYELPGAEKTMRRFTIDVIERTGGEASTLLFTFVGLDDLQVQSILLQRRMVEQASFTRFFLEPYQAAYYVGLDDLSVQPYKQTPLLEERYGVIANYVAALGDFINTEVHPDDREEFAELIRPERMRELLATQPQFSYTYRQSMSGEERICRFQVIRGADEDHAAFGFMDITEEVLEQEEEERRLQEALAMAQSANKAKTTFLNNMSHDIRTPMNAIIGYTGLAASHIDNKEQVRDYLGKIGQSSNHLLSLINDVLDMSRIESGKMNLDEQDENLSDIIHTLRDIVQADVRSKQLDFYVDAVDVNDEDIVCDKLRLNQVLLNILSNAIKYTPAGGNVSLRVIEKTVKESGYATYEFHVKDNGMGMTPDFVQTIFDPFTRVHSSTVSGIQGTGLGMAITKNIIDMMGGKIEIESAPGEGTEVNVIFDFMLQSAPKTPVRIPELEGVRGLVVDDDLNTCAAISGMLEDIGMRDEWCTSGKEAVFRAEEAFRKGDLFKLFIIDWLMPDMNGIETARRIRKVVGEEAPIIILSAYDWADVEEEGREAGVTAFVSKPLFPSDLHKVLSSCLGKMHEAAEEEAEVFDFSGKRVLLAEDNELNREIAQELLEEYGFIVEAAEDGDIAVEMVQAIADRGEFDHYDLVLMDIQMPRMDGFEATRRIRAIPDSTNSHLPIIAMTANAFEEDRKAALEAGMDEHIAKPIDVDKLRETLARYL